MDTESYDTGVIKVCGEEDVNRLCFQGYRLRTIIYTDRIERCAETTTARETGYDQHKLTVDKPFMLREPRFVMVQIRDDALAGERQRIEELLADVRRMDDAFATASRAAASHEKRVKELEGGQILIRDALQDQIRQTEEACRTNRKLESDIAKVRAAVGELKMKEILGA